MLRNSSFVVPCTIHYINYFVVWCNISSNSSVVGTLGGSVLRANGYKRRLNVKKSHTIHHLRGSTVGLSMV